MSEHCVHDLTGAKLEAERATDDVAAYALILGRAEGRAEERAAIVAWLRSEQLRLEALANKQSAYMRDEFTDGQAYWSDMAADAIENGEHLRGDDE